MLREGFIPDDGFSYALQKEDHLTIIVLSNRRQPVAGEICFSLNAIYHNKSYDLPLARNRYKINPKELDNFVGHYQLNDAVQFSIQRSKDSLFVLMGPHKVHLTPQSPNQFYMENQDAEMRFIKDSTGTFNSVVLLNGFIQSNEVARRLNR